MTGAGNPDHHIMPRILRSPRIRRLAWAGGVALLVGAGAVLWAGHRIAREASRVHTVSSSPVRHVALVLGCSPRLRDGRENWFFRNRIECAAQLFREGKAHYLLVSGDNSRKEYDEPTAMKEALVQLGVPAQRIYLDYAGFSTLDSVVRAQAVFGQQEILIVSQKDHVMRALYIAAAHGIRAAGVAARDVGFQAGLRTRVREALARVRTVLDIHVLGRTPHFLGPRVPIPGSGPELI